MIFAQKDFEIEDVLSKPLMAHLSTVEDGAPPTGLDIKKHPFFVSCLSSNQSKHLI